jgi:hypothetical protein
VTFELTEVEAGTRLVVTERALLLPTRVGATLSARLPRGIARLELRCSAGQAHAIARA